VLAAAAKAHADGYEATTPGSRDGGGGGGWVAGGVGAEVRGPAVRWGPWRVQAAVGLVRSRSGGPASDGPAGGGWGADAYSAATACEAVPAAAAAAGGLVWLASGVAWTQTNTLAKQAALLPLLQLPSLAAPLLGDLAPEGSATDAASAVVPSLRVLLGGSLAYALLLPLPHRLTQSCASLADAATLCARAEAESATDGCGGRDWDWSLVLQPDAKLLPLRSLDRTTRQLVPLVAPVPNAPGSSGSSPAAADGAAAHCYVEVRYAFEGAT
jgi:hypothetical protein